jgi:hypothetical protein
MVARRGLLFLAFAALGALVTVPMSETPREACHRWWRERNLSPYEWCDHPPADLYCVTTPEGGVRGAGCILGLPVISYDE